MLGMSEEVMMVGLWVFVVFVLILAGYGLFKFLEWSVKHSGFGNDEMSQ